MAIVETTTRNIPCDNPNEAHVLAGHWHQAQTDGVMLRLENEGAAEFVNPSQVVGITDGTLA